MKHLLTIAALTALALSGCMAAEHDHASDCWKDATPTDALATEQTPTPVDFASNQETPYVDMGFDGENWPDLSGHTITILDHGAFDWAFSAAKPAFENLTGATVNNVPADDAGTALQLAIQDQNAGGGSFDILYGVDNVLMQKAVSAGIFEPYTPFSAERVEPEYAFVLTEGGAWVATPVDHGYIAVNVDARSDVRLDTLEDLVEHADQFVTMDPRFSSPGLGFLLATVATFGEDCYLDYWHALMDHELTVTQGWTEGYVDRFSGGYGQFEEGTKADKPIVTSYTTSPAYEMFYGYEEQNAVLAAPQSTFQQIQTMGILNGADRVAAQAWIEFTLSDAFQSLAAEYNAIYPVVSTPTIDASVESVYAGNDPAPGSFTPAQFAPGVLGEKVDGWVEAWTDQFEEHRT